MQQGSDALQLVDISDFSAGDLCRLLLSAMAERASLDLSDRLTDSGELRLLRMAHAMAGADLGRLHVDQRPRHGEACLPWNKLTQPRLLDGAGCYRQSGRSGIFQIRITYRRHVFARELVVALGV